MERNREGVCIYVDARYKYFKHLNIIAKMSHSITTLMDEEHKRIENLFFEFEKNLEKNPIKAKNLFNQLKWNIKKHFIVEEKAIFRLSGSLSENEIGDIFELMKEHGEIAELMNIIERNLLHEKQSDISDFKNMIASHAKFEDDVFYPKLDEVLSLEQKQEIVGRAGELIRG